MWRQKDFDAALVGIARVGLDGRWLDLNPALCRLMGQRRQAMSKLRFQDVTHPDDLEQDLAEVDRLLQKGEGSYSMVKRYLRPDGEAFWANLNVSLSLDRHGAPDYFVSVIQDFSSTKQELDRLQHAASHDKLTDLANRDRFESALSEAISFSRRTGQALRWPSSTSTTSSRSTTPTVTSMATTCCVRLRRGCPATSARAISRRGWAATNSR